MAKSLKKMILAMIHDQYMFFSTERIVNKMVVLDLIFTPTYHFHFTCTAYVDITLNWLHNTITNKFQSTGAGNKALSFFHLIKWWKQIFWYMAVIEMLSHQIWFLLLLQSWFEVVCTKNLLQSVYVGQYHRLFLSW